MLPADAAQPSPAAPGPATPAGPRLLTVCTGRSATLVVPHGQGVRRVQSAIGKTPVSTLESPTPVAVGRMGVEGDEQVDQSVHGGLAQAVYCYSATHLPVWQTMRRQAGLSPDLAPGIFGENLLIEGLTEPDLWVGDRLVMGELILGVTRPREPCFKFSAVMGFPKASAMMQQSGYTGWYCQVIAPGTIEAGMAVTLIPGPREVRLVSLQRKGRR